MIYIIRAEGDQSPPMDVKMVRRTPAIVPHSAGRTDYFCLGDPEAAKQAGCCVVSVHDGWYADDHGGGMAIWGQGMFWEVRETPFVVTQACGPEAWSIDAAPEQDVVLNVRQAIYRG